MADALRDPVAEYITRMNADAGAKFNPLFPKQSVPRPVPPELASDPVASFLWRRNEAAR